MTAPTGLGGGGPRSDDDALPAATKPAPAGSLQASGKAAPRIPSIRAQLINRLVAGLALAIVVAAIATYLKARDEANELFDVQLRETAASITGMPLAGGAIGDTSADQGLVVQVWDRNGVRVYLPQAGGSGSAPADDVPRRQPPGFATIDTPSGAWRVYSVLAGGQLVQVGQPMAVRRELAASLALRTVTPLLVAAPFVLLIAVLAVRRGLEPIDRLASAVQRRSPRQLDRLPESGWPREAVPLVEALNGLLHRLDAALGAQRAFVADAAHELRTPLAALHLQAQLAERAGTSGEREAAMASLREGIARATRLVEQLLALARSDPGVGAPPTATVDLAAIARDVVAELAPLAARKSVDIGVEAPEAATMAGDPAGLRTLLANLVDNAIRYTPDEGRVDVAVRPAGNAMVLAVRDDGPGIPESDRERVFDRFVRGGQTGVEGSGLGLAIVRRIAERHGARVDLGEGLDGRGLAVTITFPSRSA
jgi:two-component system OmpR family sensor kinase